MLNDKGEIIYTVNTKNLKNRVSSYFRSQAVSLDIQAMVTKIVVIEVTVTHTEVDELLLESHLIKRHKSHHNVNMVNGFWISEIKTFSSSIFEFGEADWSLAFKFVLLLSLRRNDEYNSNEQTQYVN